MAGTNVLVSAVVAPAGVCGALIAAAAAGERLTMLEAALLQGHLSRSRVRGRPSATIADPAATKPQVRLPVPTGPRRSRRWWSWTVQTSGGTDDGTETESGRQTALAACGNSRGPAGGRQAARDVAPCYSGKHLESNSDREG